MHIPLWATLLHAARHNGSILLERTNTDDICLPTQLQTAVPACAIQCLQTFVANNYNSQTCTTTADINFLCTNPTNSGLTIGEGSLQCVISSCFGADIESQSGYTICDGISGALPNMAGTITATVSAITTLLSSTEASFLPTTSVPAAPSTSDISPTAATTDVPASSFTESVAPITTSTSSFLSSSTRASESDTLSDGLTSSSSGASVARSSDISSILTSSASSSSESITKTSTSAARTTGTATNSATAAAATEGASRSELSTSAIAGIITAVVVIAALLIGYLAYWFYIRRKEKRRRSQRLTGIFTPQNENGAAGPALPIATENFQGGILANAMKRFYSNETSQENRQSVWRRSALVPDNIGIAVAASTRVSPERRIDTVSGGRRVSWPSPMMAMHVDRSRQAGNEGRWSPTSSFDEDIEAQGQALNQDLPVLASPRTRASSRSFSSAGVEKPAPLRLSKIKNRSDGAQAGTIPLTPVYDNGTYEPTIRQVFEGFEQPAGLIRLSRDRQTPNFSRREPSLPRTSQEDTQPSAFQVRQPAPLGRFPVKPTIPPRKQSDITDRSMSVHTDIDEDSTPEEENDKQLKEPRQLPYPLRLPLKEIQYPQVPRPAATSKQAEKPHSPRALTIRRVEPSDSTSPLQRQLTTRAQLVKAGPNFERTNTSSSSDLASQSSESPIFPTPPSRLPGRSAAPDDLKLRISDAFRTASRPLTVTTYNSSSTRRVSEYPPSAYPGAARPSYPSPTIQRLSTGRPLAQRLQAQGYMPRPPSLPMPTQMHERRRPSARPSARPVDPRSGDLYFTVDGMGR